MANQIDLLAKLREHLRLLNSKELAKKVFVGFDGFVDHVKKAVRERKNYKVHYFKTIQEFASRLSAASGKSAQVEMVTQTIKLGGNAPILANTLGRLGVGGYCVGSMGYPARHPVFSAFNTRCEVVSVLDPGESDAVEFNDGKLIFSDLNVFDTYTWDHVKVTAGIEKLREAVQNSSLVALVDWANLHHASDLWDGLLHDIIKPSGRKDFSFLFDLCDPSKKTSQQIDEVMDLMSCFSTYGNVTFALNENETLRIWCAINGIDFANAVRDAKLPSVKEAGSMLFKSMNISCLLVHPVDCTIAYRAQGVIELKGRLVTKPRVLTGGGDNLNAGYCLGVLAGFSMEDCILLGMAASGSYIENGVSPDLGDLITYLDIWIAHLEQDEHQKPAP